METSSICLELRVTEPPGDCLVGLQSGKGSSALKVATVLTSSSDLGFEVPLKVRSLDSTRVRFTGPFVQEDSKGQFVYLCWRKYADGLSTTYDRRTKVYLNLLSPDIVSHHLANSTKPVIEIAGKARDGGPACATVPVKLL